MLFTHLILFDPFPKDFQFPMCEFKQNPLNQIQKNIQTFFFSRTKPTTVGPCSLFLSLSPRRAALPHPSPWPNQPTWQSDPILAQSTLSSSSRSLCFADGTCQGPRRSINSLSRHDLLSSPPSRRLPLRLPLHPPRRPVPQHCSRRRVHRNPSHAAQARSLRHHTRQRHIETTSY